MTPGDLCLRIESRQINLGENVRKRIGPPNQVTVPLQTKCCIQLSRSCHHQLGRSAREARAGISPREWLHRPAMRAINIVSRNSSTAKAAEDHRYSHRVATQIRGRDAVTYLARAEFLEMPVQRVAHFGASLEP